MAEDTTHLAPYILGRELFEELAVRSESVLENRHIPRFNWESTARILTTTNILLSLFSRPGDKSFGRLQNFVANAFCTDSLLIRLQHTRFNGRVAFFRQQILTALKKFLRSGAQADGLLPNEREEDRKALGRVLLNLNSFLAPPDAEGLEELITQLVPLMELYNPPGFDRGIVRTVGYLDIFDRNWPDFEDGKTIGAYFKSATGLSLDSLLQITGALYAYYLIHDENLDHFLGNLAELNLDRTQYFRLFDVADDIDAFFCIYSRSLAELREEVLRTTIDNTKDYYDFGLFRRHPIVNLSDHVFTCLDFGFLTEKVSFGFYRTLFNALPDDPKKPNSKIAKSANKLQQLWGKTIEEYVTGILAPAQNFYSNVSFNLGKGKPEEIDGVFIDGDRVVLLEVKGRFLSAVAKYSASSTLIEELDRKFGRVSQGDRGGVYQLVQDIKSLFENSEKVLDLTCPTQLLKARIVYPVLVADENALSFDLVQELLRRWFNEHEFDRRHFPAIGSLLVLSVDSLERLEPYLLSGRVTFIEFVSFYESEVQRGLPAYNLDSHRVLIRFLKQRGFFENGTWENNARTSKVFSDFMDSITARLYPNSSEYETVQKSLDGSL